MLKDVDVSERDRILTQFHQEVQKLEGRQQDQKEAQQDKLKAKLAARKRMKEQLTKDNAVVQELDRITKDYVSFVL